VRIEPDTTPSTHADGAKLRGMVVESGPDDDILPFRAAGPVASAGRPLELTLVPYHRWAERGPATMRIFIPVTS
jgi:DUF1680 family protein